MEMSPVEGGRGGCGHYHRVRDYMGSWLRCTFRNVAFFLGAGVVGMISRRYRVGIKDIIQKKGGWRDGRQVMANGVLALVAAILYIFFSLSRCLGDVRRFRCRSGE